MMFTSYFSKLLLVPLATVLLASAGFAATLDVGGIKVEDSLTIYNNTLLLNGAGMVMNGKVPQYLTDQISNYQAALSRLTGGQQ